MKLFNRILAVLLVTVLFLTLVACGGNDTPDTTDGDNGTTAAPSDSNQNNGTTGGTGTPGGETTGGEDPTGGETTGSETTGIGETSAPVTDDTFQNMSAQELVDYGAEDVEDWSKYESVTVSERTENGLDGALIVNETITTTIRVYNWNGEDTDYDKLRVYIRKDYRSEAYGDVMDLVTEITIVKGIVYIREAAGGLDISLTRMNIDDYLTSSEAVPGWLALNAYLPTYFTTLNKQEAGENFEVVYASPKADSTLELIAKFVALIGYEYETSANNSSLESASGSSLYSKEGVLLKTEGTFDFTLTELNSKNHYEISTTYSFDVNATSIKEPQNANSYLEPSDQ